MCVIKTLVIDLLHGSIGKLHLKTDPRSNHIVHLPGQLKQIELLIIFQSSFLVGVHTSPVGRND
jgi:hypothetical protein